jgi:hypothetical protein
VQHCLVGSEMCIRDRHLSKKQEEIADKDPTEISAKCHEDKEFNPKTKRCVKKCKDGYMRNDNFRCYKIKTRKILSAKQKSVKKCHEDKELNPKTNRCVKKCKEGFIRNADYRCIKNKNK